MFKIISLNDIINKGITLHEREKNIVLALLFEFIEHSCKNPWIQWIEFSNTKPLIKKFSSRKLWFRLGLFNFVQKWNGLFEDFSLKFIQKKIEVYIHIQLVQ